MEGIQEGDGETHASEAMVVWHTLRDVKDALMDVYSVHNPEKATTDSISTILTHFDGVSPGRSYDDLFEQLFKKYKIDDAPPTFNMGPVRGAVGDQADTGRDGSGGEGDGEEPVGRGRRDSLSVVADLGAYITHHAHKISSEDDARLHMIFHHSDRDGDGRINVRELLIALRHDITLASLLHLPAHIRQEDGTREAFEEVFQAMDEDDERGITFEQFRNHVMQWGMEAMGAMEEGAEEGGGGSGAGAVRGTNVGAEGSDQGVGRVITRAQRAIDGASQLVPGDARLHDEEEEEDAVQGGREGREGGHGNQADGAPDYNVVFAAGKRLGMNFDALSAAGGCTVKEIQEGRAAAATGEVKVGDWLLSVNGEDVSHSDRATVIGLIKGAMGADTPMAMRFRRKAWRSIPPHGAESLRREEQEDGGEEGEDGELVSSFLFKKGRTGMRSWQQRWFTLVRYGVT
jgi:hypothetical protein